MNAKWGLPPETHNIPDALAKLPRWVVWVAIEQNGRATKVPRQPLRPDRGASTNTPAHWATFDEARTAARDNDVNGIGFVLTQHQDVPLPPGLITIDIDHCVDEHGALSDTAREIVSALDTYTELSPSGRGLRLFAFGELPGGSFLNNAAGVEMYGGDSPRYVTVTGHLQGERRTIRRPAPAAVAAIYGKYATAGRQAAAYSLGAVPGLPGQYECAALAERALGDLSDASREFWEGGALGDRDSRSEAIQACLVNLLAKQWKPADVLAAVNGAPDILGIYMEKRGKAYGRALAMAWKDITRAASHAKDRESPPVSLDEFDDIADKPSPHRKRAKLLTISADGAMRDRPIAWLVERYIEKGYIGELFGPANVGKSALALDLAARIATSTQFNDGRKSMTGHVLYIAGEGYAGLGRRLKAWRIEHGVKPTGITLTRSALPLSEPRAVKTILAELDLLSIEPVLIVVDTLNRNYGAGSENDDEDMKKFIQGVEQLRDETGAAILVVHHSGHGNGDRSRGHSSFFAACDFSFKAVADTRDLGAVRLECCKMKDHEWPPTTGYKLKGVEIGIDEDGEPVTAVVAIEHTLSAHISEFEKLETEKAVPALQLRVLSSLATTLDTLGMAAPDDVAIHGALRVARFEDWRDTAMAGMRTDDRVVARNYWRRAHKPLIERNYVCITEDGAFVWLSREGQRQLDKQSEGDIYD